jgi:uncharacterized protein (TIGR03437 family)
MRRVKLFLGFLVLWLLVAQASLHTPRTPFPAVRNANQSSRLTNSTHALKAQGFSPMAIATTKDGKDAYIGFDLSEVVFKVHLEDLSIRAVADLSPYFPMESEDIALNASETKLFVYAATWRKLLVLDTQTLTVIHTIDNIDQNYGGLVRSEHGPFLITMNGSNTVKLVHTETYQVTSFTDSQMGFLRIQESKSDPNRWYVVSGNAPPGTWSVGVYDYTAKAWRTRFSVPQQSPTESVHALKVLPDEQKAYLATFGGWDVEGRGYGWLHSVNLADGKVKVTPIDGGGFCLEASPDSQRLYVGRGWPLPLESTTLLVFDTRSDGIVGAVPFGRTQYGWPYTQVNRLQIDPSNPSLLYLTTSDANAFVKVDLGALRVADTLILNNESLGPNRFARRPADPTGYILIREGGTAFILDLDRAIISDVVKFPSIRADAGAGDVTINEAGRLLIAQGEKILEVDPANMRLLATHPLPADIAGFWSFVLSRDKTKLYSVWNHPATGVYSPNIFLALDAGNFQVVARLALGQGGFTTRPYELPNGSKLYTVGGLKNGPVVVQVIETGSYAIKKTITFDEPGLIGTVGAPLYPYAYDSNSHTLFVGATYAVLALDTDTDTIKKVIRLADTATAIGLKPYQLTYSNANGLAYQPQENCLYIVHGDRNYFSIYDLGADRFLPTLIPLKGFAAWWVFSNDDRSKVYTLNGRSDSVSVISTKSKRVEKVIDLHAHLETPNVSAASYAGDALAVESIVSAFGSNLAMTTQGATALPLPTVLGGTSVKVVDSAGAERQAPLYFVSPTQVNYQVPPGTALGPATIKITNAEAGTYAGSVEIVSVAPGVFSADGTSPGLAAANVLRVRVDGSQSYEPVARLEPVQNRIVAVPIDLGPEGDQVYLLLYGTGIRKRSSVAGVRVSIGGTDGTVSYAGPQAEFPGLDQVNALLPRSLRGRGEVEVALTVDGKAANPVRVNVR